MKGRSPNRPQGVGVGWGRWWWGSEERGAGDSACGRGTQQLAVVRENKFLKQVYLLVEEG